MKMAVEVAVVALVVLRTRKIRYKRDPKTGKTIVDTGPFPVGIFDQLIDYYINGEIPSQ